MPDRTIWRILDANLNRAREALRVIEELARFGLDRSDVTADLKALRHDLAAVAAVLPQSELLAARDAALDVGAELTTPAESRRDDVQAVATASLKRLQEALRAIEEYGKVINPNFSAAIERLRFRAYTLEKSFADAGRPNDRLAQARLYVLVTEALCRRPWIEVVSAAIAGGADVVQLREKDLPDAEYLRRAEAAADVCRRHGALFAVNDRVAVAQLLRSDLVHVGRQDLPVEAVRRLVAPATAIGLSTHSIEQVRAGIVVGADYLGVGPVFATATKPHEPVAGLSFARAVAAERLALPCFALGGITLENLPKVLDAGVRRIAVSAAVIADDDPERAARELRRRLDDM
jgi:thiamine-phosphate pyrophosphorylase